MAAVFFNGVFITLFNRNLSGFNEGNHMGIFAQNLQHLNSLSFKNL